MAKEWGEPWLLCRAKKQIECILFLYLHPTARIFFLNQGFLLRSWATGPSLEKSRARLAPLLSSPPAWLATGDLLVLGGGVRVVGTTTLSESR